MDDYWTKINDQVAALKSAKSAAEVVAILVPPQGYTAAPAFFGSDGDDLYDVLLDAGWTRVWSKATYWWAAEAPDGSHITYIEGDVYPRLDPEPRS